MEQENNKKQFMQNYLGFVVLFVLIFAIMTVYFLLISNKIEKITYEDSEAVFEETNVNEKTIYTVKEYNGKIGIFENEALIYTLDTYVFTLPEYDKKLLSSGIEASTQEELYEIIEEYYLILGHCKGDLGHLLNSQNLKHSSHQ